MERVIEERGGERFQSFNFPLIVYSFTSIVCTSCDLLNYHCWWNLSLWYSRVASTGTFFVYFEIEIGEFIATACVKVVIINSSLILTELWRNWFICNTWKWI